MHHGAGGVVRDYSGLRNDGTLVGGVSWLDGPWGWCLYFNGVDAFVQVPDHSSLNSDFITVECLFKATDIAGQSYPPLIKKTDASAGYSLEINHTNSQLQFWAYIAGAWRGSPAYTLSLNTFYHVGATYDGNYLRLFVNGSEVSPATGIAGTIAAATNPLEIGRDHINTNRLFEGVIALPRIYNVDKGGTYLSRSFEETRSIFGL